jgi:Mn2+/Fe2+ NRAMP family transporter
MSSKLDRERKFWIALMLYGVLGAVVWFTLGEGKVLVLSKSVEIRWIPLFVLGTFAFRTYVAREADKIRRHSQEEAGEL